MVDRIRNDNPLYIYDDATGRVIGMRQPNGQDEYFVNGLLRPQTSLMAPARIVGSEGAASTITNTTTESLLASILVKGGEMGKRGRIVVDGLWTYTNSANSKTLRVRVGTTSAAGASGGTAVLNTAVTTTAALRTSVIIRNRGATNSQIAGPLNGAFSASAAGHTATSIDTTADWYINICGLMAALSETITLEEYEVALRALD